MDMLLTCKSIGPVMFCKLVGDLSKRLHACRLAHSPMLILQGVFWQPDDL